MCWVALTFGAALNITLRYWHIVQTFGTMFKPELQNIRNRIYHLMIATIASPKICKTEHKIFISVWLQYEVGFVSASHSFLRYPCHMGVIL